MLGGEGGRADMMLVEAWIEDATTVVRQGGSGVVTAPVRVRGYGAWK
jgi:hypothetical protein